MTSILARILHALDDDDDTADPCAGVAGVAAAATAVRRRQLSRLALNLARISHKLCF